MSLRYERKMCHFCGNGNFNVYFGPYGDWVLLCQACKVIFSTLHDTMQTVGDHVTDAPSDVRDDPETAPDSSLEVDD